MLLVSLKIYGSGFSASVFFIMQFDVIYILLSTHIFFLVPVPSIDIIALNNQTVSESLTLESTITTVRGITSRVDIVWSSNGVELKRITNANSSLTINDSELYKDTFNIPLLSTSDDDRVFQCEMIIMTSPSSIVTTNNITLNVTGKCCMFYYAGTCIQCALCSYW